MSQSHDDTRRAEHAGGAKLWIRLGRQRHDLHEVRERSQQLLEPRHIGGEEQIQRMSTRRCSEKWSFEMCAEQRRSDVCVVLRLPRTSEGIVVGAEWGAHKRGAEGRHSVASKELAGALPVIGLGAGEVDVDDAVGLEIDEARHEQRVAEIDCVPRCSTRAGVDDATVRDRDPTLVR